MLNKKIYFRLIEISYALLERSTIGRCRHFSFVLNKSKILAIGLNDYQKSHPMNQKFGYHPMSKLHAEMAAALKLGMVNCAGLTMVNIRINRENEISNSLYCRGCSNLVRALNFKDTYYSDSNGHIQQFT